MRSWQLPVATGLLAFGARVGLIAWRPVNFSFDGYERWAGRDHLLVHDWLPGLQAVIFGVSHLGGGLLASRLVVAAVAALACAAGAVLARRLGGPTAGWAFVPMGLFSPFLTWSTVLYQEGLFLLGVLGALALATRRGAGRGTLILADLLAGGVALVRYEGWPFVALYVLWRRDPRAALALWGVALWLVVRWLGVPAFHPSPVDFADWNGLSQRWELSSYLHILRTAWRQWWATGGLLVLTLGVGGLVLLSRRRAPLAVLLPALMVVQAAAVLGWMAGLESAILRQTVVLTMLAAVPAAVLLGAAWSRWGRRWMWLPLALMMLSGGARVVWIAGQNAKMSARSVRWELGLVQRMATCQGCRVRLTPRTGIGTRARHDGCEAVQGLSEYRHGRDFWCTTWPGTAPWTPTHQVSWQRGAYVMQRLPQ